MFYAGKKIIRNVYGGGVPLEPIERSALESLRKYAKDEGLEEAMSKIEDSERLKYLADNEYDVKISAQAILEHA